MEICNAKPKRNKMDRKKFEQRLDRICELMRHENRLMDFARDELGEYMPSEHLFRVVDDYITLLEEVYDLEGDISWFIYDNDMGKCGLKYGGVPIFTIKDLYEAVKKNG